MLGWTVHVPGALVIDSTVVQRRLMKDTTLALQCHGTAKPTRHTLPLELKLPQNDISHHMAPVFTNRLYILSAAASVTIW
jgi:hypothetical protein